MTKNPYSEEEAVQKPAGELLHELHWDVFYCYDDEVLGEAGTLGRESYRDVLLKRDLEFALQELNENLSEDECKQAIKVLEDVFVGDSLLQTNEAKYNMLRDGIPVKRKLANGQTRTVLAQVFDFEHPEKNRFVAAEELWVQGPYHKRRADLVGFVNGVPLLFVEFKRHDKDVLRAYEDNYTDYLDTIPQIFYYNAFVVLSNGIESKVGTLGSAYEYFHEWKRLDEEDAGNVALETMLRGICNRKNLLDLFRNFILFDHSSSPAAKILARNHQFLGVNEAVQAYSERKLNNGKLGVFWHTQGSGKSYSMVFLSEKIKRTQAGSPTFLILTDRDELDKQISETYENCGCLAGVPASRCVATSGEDLIQKLQGNQSYIFSLIQKFNQSNVEPIHPDHDVIIFSDEAHRSNNGIFAENMMKLLPEASRIGFTGTPILDYDNLTKRTFGDYVSVYDFNRAVEDGATVPLFYENRSQLLNIENPQINDELLEAVEAEDLDEFQAEKVERQLGRGIHVLMSEARLRAIANDFVHHYSNIWESGKAMFICVNKVTCVMMFNYAQECWAKAIEEEKAKLKSLTQQERLEQERKIQWMEETEMAVVVSQEQNEIDRFRKWGLDITSHREKMVKGNLEKNFKDPSNPFRIVFVCAMWLTGFDVKPLSAMYFDKPMKAHGLMQAIARANRVNVGKSNGLIVDYIGIVKALRKALGDYIVDDPTKTTDPVIDKAELIVKIDELTSTIVEFMHEEGYDTESLLIAEGFSKIEEVKNACDVISCTDETKKRFNIMCRELFHMYKFVTPTEVGNSVASTISALRAVFNHLNKERAQADTTEFMAKAQGIVDSYIVVKESTQESKDVTRFDISNIDFDRLSQEFVKDKHKHLFIDNLREIIEARLEIALKNNPRRVDFFERYEKIIECYNSEQDKATIEKTFNDLMLLTKELDEKQKEWVREGFDNQQQMTVFEMLFKETLSPAEIKKVKEVAIDLVETINKRLEQMIHWTEKDETVSQIKVAIRDAVYKLPENNYPDSDLAGYSDEIFNYFYSLDQAA